MNDWLTRSVDEIIDAIPREEQVIVRRLRALVLECLPTATEKNTYGAPFYVNHKMICFIWPPSLTWAGKARTLQERGVSLGFCQGHLMLNEMMPCWRKAGSKCIACTSDH